MNRKYEFTGEEKQLYGRTLKRIKAKKDFENVACGDIGGWIEREENLDENGTAWIYDNARVYNNARVCGDAEVKKVRDVIYFSKVGSRNDVLTAFKTKKGFSIKIGCFLGSLEQFLKRVQESHENNKFAREYRAIAEVIKIRFEEEEDE